MVGRTPKTIKTLNPSREAKATGTLKFSRRAVPLTISEYTPDTFASRTGECFRFITADERALRGLELTLTLLEVRGPKHPEETAANERAPFSLLFGMPGEVAFLQGLCALEHPDFARDLLLLTRVMPPRGKSPGEYGSYYEAVFG